MRIPHFDYQNYKLKETSLELTKNYQTILRLTKVFHIRTYISEFAIKLA